MASLGPSTSGLTMSLLSEVMPKPHSSARIFAPRALACSYSSRTRTPAPSPSTKPSRSLSHGRLAVAGSSLRVDSARAAQKPPMPSGETVDSAPPATITSASPYSMMRTASPIECVPVVHAVTMEMFGPLKPYSIDRLPEIMLMIDPGTKNGDTLRTPAALNSSLVSSISGRPPMPEPMATPTRSGSAAPSLSRPASRTACMPAARP